MYLNELSLIFYNPEILPELVFTNPQVLLDKVTELVKVHFDLMLGIGPSLLLGPLQVSGPDVVSSSWDLIPLDT